MIYVLSILAVVAVLVLLTFLFTVYMARKVEALLPPTGRFVDVPGARLHVREFGSGDPGAPAILLVHGLAAQLEHFTYGVTCRLSSRYRIVAVDRPGSGFSTRGPGTAADLNTQARILAALIDRLQLERPLVVGHSLGGALALALALDHPHRVGALALIAPLTHMQEHVPPVFEGLTILSPVWRNFVAWTLAVPALIKNSRATLDQVFGPEPVPHDFATRGGGLLGLRPGAFLSASDDLRSLPDCLPAQQARYGELEMPVTILYGKDDRILDPRAHGQALADKVRGARLELIEGGHMLPVTNPEATAAFIMAPADGQTASTAISAARS
ncbi:alpha/beta fold hydrolase [Massilia putida]|uniref:alpha/beta fold hydrolase n=1 Tax=Massilia putida TaxID=1141883 RepID=UPI0009520AD0|nr:alpha/beta hydrolase [Massilia putida]